MAEMGQTLRGAAVATVTIALVLVVATAAGATSGPGPGTPFGGDDAGCVPPTRAAARTCSDVATRGLGKLVAAVIKCETKHADARYGAVVLGHAATFDEAHCEAVARARLDKTLGALVAKGTCVGGAVPSGAASAAADLLADQTNALALAAQTGALYCDATSGAPLDPSARLAGFVPSSKANLVCGDKLAKAIAKLVPKALTCHGKAADAGVALADPPFGEEACEDAALAAYDKAAGTLLAAGLCPACLDATASHAIAVAAVAARDGANASTYPCADDVVHLGTARLDRPTLMTLGVQLPITGDDNHDATVSVRYRLVGAPAWRDALPLFRVRPESVVGRVVPEQFAGSIFDVRPATSYEIELHATDPDGPVDQTLTLTATTRDVPGDPAAPHAVAVGDTAGLAAALAAAQQGDVITLADGVYAGPFVLDVSAEGTTATAPIVIRGASEEGTILDGGSCASCNVLEVYGSFVHVERLTLRHANRGLRFQTAGAEGNVMRRVHVQDTRLGLGSQADQVDFYVCDNTFEGRLAWPQIYTDDGGAHSDDDGIHVEGSGHVVCHNQVIGYGDALKNGQEGARALDFYGNEVLSAYDNAIELDLSEGNVRCLRNRFTNTYATISFQPIYGGPAYAIRNVVVNVAHEQMKFHSNGGVSGPSGVLVYHNTFVSPALALFLDTDATSFHFALENNLFVGPAALAGPKAVDWLGAIDDGLFDYDGYFPDGVFRFNRPPIGLVSFPSFAAMQAGGTEMNGVLLAEPIFASGLVAPTSYTVTLAPADVTLAGTVGALDRGLVLPNVNDGFQGTAPDLGALERGCATPIFGVRPEGIDESNEPLGCAP